MDEFHFISTSVGVNVAAAIKMHRDIVCITQAQERHEKARVKEKFMHSPVGVE